MAKTVWKLQCKIIYLEKKNSILPFINPEFPLLQNMTICHIRKKTPNLASFFLFKTAASHSVQWYMHKRLLHSCRFGLPHLLDCLLHVFLPDWADEVFNGTVMGWRRINKEAAQISFTMIQI